MGEPVILALIFLGFVAPLLPTWRAVLIGVSLFVVGDIALLIRLDADLATSPGPGPGARGVAVLAYLPVVAFAVAGCLRGLFELAKRLILRFRATDPADRTALSPGKPR